MRAWSCTETDRAIGAGTGGGLLCRTETFLCREIFIFFGGERSADKLPLLFFLSCRFNSECTFSMNLSKLSGSAGFGASASGDVPGDWDVPDVSETSGDPSGEVSAASKAFNFS